MKKLTLTLSDEDGSILDIWTTGDVLDRGVFMALVSSNDVAQLTGDRIADHLAETSEEINRAAESEPMS